MAICGQYQLFHFVCKKKKNEIADSANRRHNVFARTCQCPPFCQLPRSKCLPGKTDKVSNRCLFPVGIKTKPQLALTSKKSNNNKKQTEDIKRNAPHALGECPSIAGALCFSSSAARSCARRTWQRPDFRGEARKNPVGGGETVFLRVFALHPGRTPTGK